MNVRDARATARPAGAIASPLRTLVSTTPTTIILHDD